MNENCEDTHDISRRGFLSRTAAGVYLSGGAFGLLNSMISQRAQAGELDEAAAGNRLVVIQLGGGNDNLNTIVPYAHTDSDIYYSERPTLAIPSASVLDLDGAFGLHPSMAALKAVWDASEMAIVHGVGYPNPILSHFAAIDKWYSAMPSGQPASGWLERLFDHLEISGESSPLLGLEIAERTSLAFGNGRGRVTLSQSGAFDLLPSFYNNDQTVDRLKALVTQRRGRFDRANDSTLLDHVRVAFEQSLTASTVVSGVAPSPHVYPNSPLGGDMKRAAELMRAGLDTRVFYLHTGGFDTHAGQIVQNQPTVGKHSNLLRNLSDSVGAFTNDMKDAGLWDNTLVLIFSEFSRKVIQNGGLGTDHGAGQAVMLCGGSVVPGMHGTFPSLAEEARVENHSLDYSTDFRRVYRTIFERWLGVSPSLVGSLFPDAPADFSLLPFLPELS